MHPVAKALHEIAAELNIQFIARRDMVEACLLALLAKEHLFALSTPGNAKTELVTNLMSRLIGAVTFETSLSRTRPEAAVLGPYNLPELRDKGDYRRKTNGFLPTANVAMIDEIGKMSPILGHDLLPIMNERKLHEVNGARSAHPVPLYTAFCPSNELITDEGDDQAALWDRLLVRCVVEEIRETSDFVKLLTLPQYPITATVQWAELAAVVDNEVPAIGLDQSAIDAMVKLRKALNDKGIYPSPRRWKKSVRVLQASAFLNGRSDVTDDDLAALRFTLWDNAEQIHEVERAATSIANPLVEKLNTYRDQLSEIGSGIKKREGKAMEERAAYAIDANKKLKTIQSDLAKLEQECKQQGRATARIDVVRDSASQIQVDVYVKMLDMDANRLPRR